MGEHEAWKWLSYEVPARTVAALRRYADQGIATGGFLRACLENNLIKAVELADRENQRNLPAIAAYIYNQIPDDCWGSPSKVTLWLARGTHE